MSKFDFDAFTGDYPVAVSRNLHFAPMTAILRCCQLTTARCAAEI